MEKKLSVLIFFVCIAMYSSAQVTFQKTYGGIVAGVGSFGEQTADVGYIIAGNSYISIGVAPDIFLIKTDSLGDSVWTKTYGGASTDNANCVHQTFDGGYIICGSTFSFGAGNSDIYLIKTDSVGDTLWTKTFGGLYADYGNSVQQTLDSGFIVTGESGALGGTDDVYLIKTDGNGDSVWTKTFDRINCDESGNSVQQTLDSGYVICGGVYNHILQEEEVYLIKTDFTGNLLWAKSFGGLYTDIGFSVQQTIDGGFIIAGFTWSFGAGFSDVYLIKSNVNGNLQSSKTYGRTEGDFATSVQQTSDGGYIVTGQSRNLNPYNSDIFLMRLNGNLDTLWTRVFGDTLDDYGNSVKQTNDGGFIVIGSTENFGASSSNIYLIKTDSLGNSNCNQGSIVFTKNVLFNTPNPATPFITSPPIFISTPATTVGSGGLVTTLCISTGVTPSPLERVGVRLSPNPSTGTFTISSSTNFVNATIEIYNVLGEPLSISPQKGEGSVTALKIDASNLPSGIYFVNVRSGEKIYNEKIIIEKN